MRNPMLLILDRWSGHSRLSQGLLRICLEARPRASATDGEMTVHTMVTGRNGIAAQSGESPAVCGIDHIDVQFGSESTMV